MPPQPQDCLTEEGMKILKAKLREAGWDKVPRQVMVDEINKGKTVKGKISTNNIGYVLRGETCNSYYIQVVCELVGFINWRSYLETDPKLKNTRGTRRATDDLPKGDRPSAISPNNIPYSGAATFVGRDNNLNILHEILSKDERVGVAISAVAGMGGVGKTEFAIQYSTKYIEDYSGGICWLFAREFNVGTQIVAFAQARLGLKIPDGLEFPDQVAFCWNNWVPGNVLVVFDDVTDFDKNVKIYLPPSTERRFRVLMTTRLRFSAPIRTVLLNVLTPESSLELLQSLIGSGRIEQELEVAKALCKWLGYLPLGLELVGRYLVEDEYLALSEILLRLEKKAVVKQALKDYSLIRNLDDGHWSLTAQRGVEAAFDLTWEELDKKAQHLGKRLSILAPAPIPWELVIKISETYYSFYPENVELTTEELEEFKRKLIRFHLLQRIDQQNYRLHSLIREFFRSKLH